MPLVSIYVTQADIEAAARIALRMFPETPDLITDRLVISNAARMGIERLKVIWGEPPETFADKIEDAANLYANASIKRDQLHRDEGRASQDLTTDGMPLKEGT